VSKAERINLAWRGFFGGCVTKPFRKTDLKFLGDVSWGTHVCVFYETKEDLLDTVVPFFKVGLESREFCVWAISEPLTEEDAINALKQNVPNFDRFLENRDIEIISGHEWYLDGDRFDLKRITDGWDEKLCTALAKGYSAMRVSGNAFWADTKHWKDFCAYEHDLDASIVGLPMSVLCTYPLARSQPADILEVSFAHQFAIARRKGNWEFINTFKARQPTQSLTARELEVLTWVAKGKTALETAQILQITKRTIDEHVHTIMQKLGAVNRTQAVAIAIQNHMINP
jgi:DNA-binding CsgD family transcriptional regulator